MNNNYFFYSEIEESSGSFKITFKINFSTFRENKSTSEYSLWFQSCSHSLNLIVSCGNVIGNKCGPCSNQVLFCGTTTIDIDHSIFLNNTAINMFKQGSQQHKLTNSDSFVDSDSAFINYFA